jgi:hypothetical protein
VEVEVTGVSARHVLCIFRHNLLLHSLYYLEEGKKGIIPTQVLNKSTEEEAKTALIISSP